MRARTSLLSVAPLALLAASCSLGDLDVYSSNPSGAGGGAAGGTAGSSAGSVAIAGAAGGPRGGSGGSGASGSAGFGQGGAAGLGSGGGGVGGGGGAAATGGAQGGPGGMSGQSGAAQSGSAGEAGKSGSAGEAGKSGSTQAGQAGSGAGAAGSGGAAGGMGGAPAGPRCGDGLVNQADEQCDDANLTDDDACTNVCKVRCSAPASFLAPQSNRCLYFVEPTGANAAPPDAFGGTDAVCNGPGVHIAMLADPRDAAWIGSANATGAPRAWIGARATGSMFDSRDDFAWFEGGPVTDALWQASQPDATPGELCADLRVVLDGSMSHFRVGNNVCGVSSVVDRVLCAREPVCRAKDRDGVVGANGHCYIVDPVPTSRPIAAAFCADLGGHLATFETPDELYFLGGYGIRDAWVGATQASPLGGTPSMGWQWTDGPAAKVAVSASLWNGADPNDGGSGKTTDTGAEQCAALFAATRRLHDLPCTELSRALCEIE